MSLARALLLGRGAAGGLGLLGRAGAGAGAGAASLSALARAGPAAGSCAPLAAAHRAASTGGGSQTLAPPPGGARARAGGSAGGRPGRSVPGGSAPEGRAALPAPPPLSLGPRRRGRERGTGWLRR